jgi:hypothetical protein
VIGSVTDPVPPGSATLIDRRTTIHVVLAHPAMTLANADAAALDQGANLALVGDELLQFGTATYLGGSHWRLSELWRGRRGTNAGASGTGSRFVPLEEPSMIVLAVGAEPGARVLVSASGTGDISAAEAEVVLTGASMLPLAPVHLRATETPEGISLSWRRRSRADWRWRDGVDAALGEEREAYRVTVTGGDGETRLFEPREPALLLTEERAGALSIAVRQLGTNGASAAAAMVIRTE